MQKVDQYTVHKWLNHGTKHHKKTQPQRLKYPLQIFLGESINLIQGSSMTRNSIQYSQRRFEDRNAPVRHVIADVIVDIKYINYQSVN